MQHVICIFKVKNVSKIPGPIGPPGYNGSEGPVGRKGSDFSQCQYATTSADMIPGTTRVLVSINEPTVSTSILYI